MILHLYNIDFYTFLSLPSNKYCSISGRYTSFSFVISQACSFKDSNDTLGALS